MKLKSMDNKCIIALLTNRKGNYSTYCVASVQIFTGYCTKEKQYNSTDPFVICHDGQKVWNVCVLHHSAQTCRTRIHLGQNNPSNAEGHNTADITVRYCTMFCATYSCISIKILYYTNRMFKVQYANRYTTRRLSQKVIAGRVQERRFPQTWTLIK